MDSAEKYLKKNNNKKKNYYQNNIEKNIWKIFNKRRSFDPFTKTCSTMIPRSEKLRVNQFGFVSNLPNFWPRQ